MATLISDIAKAAALIAEGQVVAFPTETVYGLGADARNADACRRIYQIKGRPSINPLIVHVSCLDEAREIGDFSQEALDVAKKFWPGPLTIVVKQKAQAKIATNVTAGLATVAIRVPAHEVALEIIKLSGKAIAAPSANLSNYISATSAEHVMEDFYDKDLHVLFCKDYQNWGLESTIADFSNNEPIILRHGCILAQDMNIVQKVKVFGEQIKAPGMLLKHYSPRSKLYLNAASTPFGAVGIDFASQIQAKFSLSEKGYLVEAAMNLYRILRQADLYSIQNNYNKIVVASIPKEGLGIAINDKLTRAAN